MTSIAPVVGLLLTLQFGPPAAGLNILDLAELRRQFSEYPLFNQIGRAGPMSHDPALVEVNIGSYPRLQFLSEDLTRVVLFQEDRVSAGWEGAGATGTYPGFSDVFRAFEAAARITRGFLNTQGSGASLPVTGEIVYTDLLRFPMDRDLPAMSDVLRVFNRVPHFRATVHNSSWNVILEDPALTGFGVVAIAAPVAGADGAAGVQLETTIRFSLHGKNWDTLRAPFDAAHGEAIRIFKALVIPEIVATSGL